MVPPAVAASISRASPSVPSSASVPAMRAQISTITSISAIRRNDSAAAVG